MTDHMLDEGSANPKPAGQVAISCPRCGRHALWNEPFLLHSLDKGIEAPPGPHIHRWGSRLVEEKYPSVLPWNSPSVVATHQVTPSGRGAYATYTLGVVQCAHCHIMSVHQLKWPEDAYFQWVIRGYTLWAWNAEHAGVLLEYLGAKQRDASKYPGYTRSLLRLPGEVISAKVRPLIVKRISKSLAERDT